MSDNAKALGLLRKAAAQFRLYEHSHQVKAKATRDAVEKNERLSSEGAARAEECAAQADRKAVVNGALARELEDFLRTNSPLCERDSCHRREPCPDHIRFICEHPNA